MAGDEAAPAPAAVTEGAATAGAEGAPAPGAESAAAEAPPPEESPAEKAHKAYETLLDVDLAEFVEQLIGFGLQGDADALRGCQKPLKELDMGAAAATGILEEARETFRTVAGSCRLVEGAHQDAANKLAPVLESFMDRVVAAQDVIKDAEEAAYKLMVAKRKAAKSKEKEKDLLDCKFWISWDSMYRRVKMGKWIGLSCSADQTAKLWDMTKLECRGTLGGMTVDIRHEDVVRCGAMDPDLKRCITGASDGTLILWNIETCEFQECFLSGKFGSILCIDADFKKKKAVTGTASGAVVLWDSERLCVREQINAHESSVYLAKADFAKTGRMLTASKADGRIRVWDLETSTCIGTFEGKSPGGPTNICHVDWQKRRVLSGSECGELYLWDLDSCAEIHCFSGHDDKINNVHVDPSFKMGVSASNDDTARIWELEARKAMGKLEGHVQPVRDVRADWKNNFIATCSDDTTVRIWDTNSFQCKKVLEGHLDRVTTLRCRYDREMLLSASDDYTVRIWDLENMVEEGVLYGHSGSVRTVIAKDVQDTS